MRYIIDSGERQVQPADFSFLSDADKEIVAGFEATLRQLCGFNSNNPIVLSGIWVDVTAKPNPTGNTQTNFKITGGKILYNATLVDFAEMDVVKPTYEYDTLLDSVVWMLRQSNSSPSPVRNRDGELKVNCHIYIDSWAVQRVNAKPSSIPDGHLWVLSDMYRVQPMASLSSMYELQTRIEKLEQKYLLPTTINSIASE